MDLGLVFSIIGKVFFREGVITLIFIVLFGWAAVAGLKKTAIAIALYFSISIINPQSVAPFFYSIRMVKWASIIALISLFLNQDQAKFFFPNQFLALLLFLIFSNISASTALIPDLADKRQEEFNKIALICFITVWVVRNRRDYKILFYTTVLSFYFNVLKNLVETQTKGRWYAVSGTSGWIGDSNDWALALAMVIPLFYVAVVLSQSWKSRFLHIGATLSALLILTITSSRGGFLGAAAGALVMLVTEKKRKRALMIIFLMLPILGYYAPTSYVDQVKSIFEVKDLADDMWHSGYDPHASEEYTGAERVWNWKIAYKMMKDYPVTGVGWGNYVPARQFYELVPGDTVCHSTWFQVGSEAGFAGLFSFVLIILTALFSLFRTWRKANKKGDWWISLHARAVMSGLVAFCVAGSFVSREYSDLLFLYFCMAVILPLLLNRVTESDVNPELQTVPNE